MEDRKQRLYEVSNCGRRKLHIYANDGNQAKRIYCREYGLTAGDYHTGIRALSARALNPDEEKAYLEQSDGDRATLTFIKGMLDIYVKAHRDSRDDMER